MRYMPVSKPIPRDDGTVEPAAESSKLHIRNTIKALITNLYMHRFWYFTLYCQRMPTPSIRTCQSLCESDDQWR